MDKEYIIYSNKYSLHERKTKLNGTVYDVYFRVWDKDGKAIQKKLSGFKTKTEAKQRYNRFVQDHCEFVYDKPKKKAVEKDAICFLEVYKNYIKWMEANCKSSTLYDTQKGFGKFILPAFGKCTLDEITKESINRWQDELSTLKKSDGSFYSYKYQKKIRGYFSTFLSWCEARYDFTSPMRFTEKIRAKSPKKEMQIWTREEFQKFIDVVDEPLYHALFTTMFFTGRREGEILALSPSDVDIKNKRITFNKSITYKTNTSELYLIVPTKAYKEQTLPVAQPVVNELLNYGIKGKFVFGNDRPLPPTTVTRYFNKYIELSGVKRIRIHDLRHSFVSMLIHNGVNLAVVADLISDTLEQVTKTYAHMYTEDRDMAIAQIK